MHVAICTPCYAQELDYEHAKCIEDMVRQMPKGHQLDTCRVHGCALIVQSRCLIAQHALDLGAEVLLWIDGDILFDPDDAWRLCQDCLDHPIIGMACTTKRPGGRLCCEFPAGTRRVSFFEQGGIFEVEMIGLGITAIHRKVFERLAEDLPEVMGPTGHRVRPYFQTIIHEGTWYGEDFAFCQLAREAGFGIYVDTRPRTWHKGRYAFRVEDIAVHVPKIEQLTIDVQTGLAVLDQPEPKPKRETG